MPPKLRLPVEPRFQVVKLIYNEVTQLCIVGPKCALNNIIPRSYPVCEISASKGIVCTLGLSGPFSRYPQKFLMMI